MTPYYSKDSIEIYHGDCREILPTLEAESVDLVVTSPPYNTLPLQHKPSGIHAKRRSGINQWIKKASVSYKDNRPEEEYQEWLSDIVTECLRVCRGLVWINHKVRYRKGRAVHPVRFLKFPIYAEVVWDRHCSMALNCKRYAPSHENLWAFGKPHVWHDDLNTLMSVWRIRFDYDDNAHPCSFPIEIAKRPIASSSDPNDLILDPFMGSGTTLVAAKELHRRCIGIELEEASCEIAVNRLAQEVLPFEE